MKKDGRMLFSGLIITMLIVVFAAVCPAAETTVVGKITDDDILQTDDGKWMKVADTEMGRDLLSYVGKKVEVLGVTIEEKGKRVIRVTAFTVIEE
jgi:hypothetical protein